MDSEIAWAAGLFEGEGSISALNKNGVQMGLGMTDRDVVDSFHRVVGVGAVYVEPRSNPKHSTCYRWKISSKADIHHVLSLLSPWFHGRRKAKVAWALERLEGNHGPKSLRTHCLRGHVLVARRYTGRSNGARFCPTCHNERRRIPR